MELITDLIRQCLAGNKKAWDTFVDDYSRWIYHCILQVTRSYGRRMNAEDIEELCQDVFLILLDKGLRQFRGREKPELLAYIRRIAVCHTINYLKKCNRYVGIEDLRLDNGAYGRLFQELEKTCPGVELNRLDAVEQIKNLLEYLSAEERQMLEMCYFDQLSPKEIAEKFLITVDTYYVRKNRVLNKLKSHSLKLQKILVDNGEGHA